MFWLEAHTCTNTLELPNYDDALRQSGFVAEDQISAELRRLLGEKLRLAIKETASYELDAIDAESVAPALRSLPGSDAYAGTAAHGWRSDGELPVEDKLHTPVAQLSSARAAGFHDVSSAESDTLAELASDGRTLAARGVPMMDEGSEQSSSASVLLVDERGTVVHAAPSQSAVAHEVDGLLEDPGLLNSLDFLQKQPATQIAPPPGKIAQDIDSLIEELELDLAIPRAQAPMWTPKESLT